MKRTFRRGWVGGLLGLLVSVVGARAASPAAVHHYVFFGFERERIAETNFLGTAAFEGAQLKYSWRELEPEPGRYDFEAVRRDLAFLTTHGKRLFVQVQETSFDPVRKLVPRYLLEDRRYHGGVDAQYEFAGEKDESATPAGWVARRWDPAVRRRFHRLLAALGREFDARIEGLNLPETAVDFGETGRFYPRDFTPERYRRAVIATIRALRQAFPKSVTLQYANFMPGEWLPDRDRGYLRSVYAAAWKLGVGVGGPDLLPHRPAQRQHAYPLIRSSAGKVPTGIAVQDGNLAARRPDGGERVTAEDLLRYAVDELRVTYVFWGTEEPYFTAQVVPLLGGPSGP